MGLLGVLLLGVGLSLDTFAVSLSLGFAGCTTHRQRMRFLIVIGIFHFLMIMAGWFLGENVGRLIADTTIMLQPFVTTVLQNHSVNRRFRSIHFVPYQTRRARSVQP